MSAAKNLILLRVRDALLSLLLLKVEHLFVGKES